MEEEINALVKKQNQLDIDEEKKRIKMEKKKKKYVCSQSYLP